MPVKVLAKKFITISLFWKAYIKKKIYREDAGFFIGKDGRRAG